MFKTIAKKSVYLLIIMSMLLIVNLASAKNTNTLDVSITSDSTAITYSNETTSFEYVYTPDYITCETSALISPKTGGYLCLSSAMWLYVPPKAFNTKTTISAHFEWYTDYIDFVFGPSPMSFAVPLKLFISWYDINQMGLLFDPSLFYDDGVGTPVYYTEDAFGITYYLEHFSIYYFRRR